MEFTITNGILEDYRYEEDETDIVIPDDVTSIGDMAFRQCQSLKSIVLPQSIKSIGSKAFVNCFELKKLICGGKEIPFENSSEISMELIQKHLT